MESNKPIGSWAMAMTMAGFYLGAGYLSGQELWQFFGVYGKWGVVGMALAVSLISALGIALFQAAQLSGLREFDRVTIRFQLPWLRAAFSYVEMFFTFCVLVIMSAGGSALLYQVMGLPSAIGSALFCLGVALVALKGVSGMLAAFNMLVPLLTAVTLAVALCAAMKNNGQPIRFAVQTNSNPLLGNWAFSALTYLSYNFVGAICVFAPIAHMIPMKTVRRGSVLGGAVLLAIAMAVFFSISMFPEAAEAQLPMLALATSLSPYLGYLCAVPLLCGMFGTSLSALVAVLSYGELKLPKLASKRVAVTALLSLLAWACSLVGFGELISVLYPICGYVGFGAIALLLEHLVWLKRQVKNDDI